MRHLFIFANSSSQLVLNSTQLTPIRLFSEGTAREPYNRRQWGSALRATPKPPRVVLQIAGPADNLCVTCLRFPASLASLPDLVNVSYCWIRAKYRRLWRIWIRTDLNGLAAKHVM
jgi:hypothetical protein